MSPNQRIALSGVTLLLAVGGWWLGNRHPAKENTPIDREVPRQPLHAETLASPVLPPDVVVETAAPALSTPAAVTPADPPPTAETKAVRSMARAESAPKIKTPAAIPSVQPARRVKEPIRDPVAREALGWVGANPEAEEYWFAAINDPGLPAEERKDLIEDLNEDGLSDPKHPTLDDLPLIVRRLQLIEAVGGDSMDEVNADAFLEAYKDLVNLAYVAAGSGKPVK